MSFINVWVWWVGFWIMMGEVWFQTKVQLPLKVLVLMVKKPPTFCEIYIRNHLGIIEGSLVATHVTLKNY
jgi:hypothetical protein